MKRTDEQKQKFVKECLRIEKAGGDVLGYIAVNWPSYSPRATWYNLQKQFLHRGMDTITEGKPTGKGKEVDEMKKRRESQRKMIEGLIDGVKAGGDPKDVLTELGYTNLKCAMRNFKYWAKQNDPDLLADLQLISLKDDDTDKESGYPVVDEAEPVDTPAQAENAAETVFFDGKEYEKAEKAEQKAPKVEQKTGDHVSAEEYRETVKFNGKEYEKVVPEKLVNPPWPKEMDGKIGDVTAYLEKPSPTCCQPAKPSGVTVPAELPVYAVKSRVRGVWELSGVADCVSLNWANLITHQQCDLSMPAEDWLKLAEEIPVMLKQLGLAK